MKVSDNDPSLRAGNNNGLKTISLLAAVSALAAILAGPARIRAAEDDGVALAIIYDTSGSMNELVLDSAGNSSPKYVIANRALISIANQVETFATKNADGRRKVEAGLFIFDKSAAREAIKFGTFEAGVFVKWANQFANPHGNTPLGNALNAAGQAVLDSQLPHKHVLVITDGINTAGPSPASVLPKLKHQAQDKQTSLSVHFVAFDVDAKVFDTVKRQGATVVGAANENQLNTQLLYILQRKILLEEEEPPRKKE